MVGVLYGIKQVPEDVFFGSSGIQKHTIRSYVQ
jgi:hypothetical protein